VRDIGGMMELLPSQPRKDVDPEKLAKAIREHMQNNPHMTLADIGVLVGRSVPYLKQLLTKHGPTTPR